MLIFKALKNITNRKFWQILSVCLSFILAKKNSGVIDTLKNPHEFKAIYFATNKEGNQNTCRGRLLRLILMFYNKQESIFTN